MTSVFLHLLKLVLWPKMSSVLKNVPCTLEKNVYLLCVACVLLLLLSHICLQSNCLQWLSAYCGQGLVPVLLGGQSRATLGLS